MASDLISTLVILANKRLNSNEDFEEFEKFVTKELNLETVCSLIKEKIDCEDGSKVLEYILVGLSVKPDAQKLFEEVYEYVLNTINTIDIPEKMKICLITRLLLELNKLSTEQLIKFVNMCKKDIENSNEVGLQSWKELIPQVLKMVSEIKLINTEGLEMTGAEYKELIITDICRYKVETGITVHLALMFRRTQLTEKEHDLVMKTLCSYFRQMTPQEIPPLLQQILHFCSSGDFLNLFCTLQNYFDHKYVAFHSTKENDTFDIEASEKKELLEAESTILFLLEDFAKVHSTFVNDITKFIKTCSSSPNMVFGPFMMAFFLTMSCCAPYEETVIDLISKLIVQSLNETENVKNSFWLKINYTEIYDVYSQFQVFIKSEISSYEKVFKGLVNLGLSLIGVPYPVIKKKYDVTQQMHQLGVFIIVALVHKRSFITGSVLRKLTDSITSIQSNKQATSNQYLECLHKLCKTQRSAVIENNVELLRLFKEMPVGLTDKVTCAVIPVLKISTYLRDNVIMILRKELMSKDYQLRHCAVLGFIEILCSVRLENMSTLSQTTNSQDSWPGLFTQIVLDKNSVDIHSTIDTEDSSDNKTISLEILDILKTCFFQKAEIKQTLYRGLTRVTLHNIELGICINSLLLDHTNTWCNKLEANNKKSLKFDKSIIIGRDKLIVHEPLEELILLAQHVLISNTLMEDNNVDNLNNNVLKNTLDQLVNFYSECNTDEIKVSETDCLLDIISNVAEHIEIIKQILSVYQALIVYIINSWRSCDQDKECNEKFHKLFSKYNHILDAVMTSDKTNKKKDKGNKKNKIETTTVATKFTEPIINLEYNVLYKFISLLTTQNDWISHRTSALLKRNSKLWEFVLKLVQTYIIEIKQLLLRDIKPLNLYENLCKLTKLLYDFFMYDICEKIKFNQTVVELGLECYLEIITLASSHYKKLDKFLWDSNQETVIDSTNEQKELFDVLHIVRLNLDKILEVNQIDITINQDDEREVYDCIEGHLIKCVSVLCNAIKSNHPRIKNVLTWLSEVTEKYLFANTNNSKDFLTLMIEMHCANQEDPIMLADSVKTLCYSFGLIDKAHKFKESQLKSLKLITSGNRTMICPILYHHLSNELNFILVCLNRIKSELSASQGKMKTLCEDRLKAREKAICHRTVLIILSIIPFTKTDIPLGQCTESIFNLLHHLYRIINTVIKHFIFRSTHHQPVYKQALFEKLSRIVNEMLSPNVSKFIIFVEHDRPLTDKEKKSVQLKNQTRRQASYIPRVVTELELFINLITRLGKKCKDKNLVDSLKLTSSRDFRINLNKIQDMLQKQNNSEESDKETEGNLSQNTSVCRTSNDSSQPPQKKLKLDSSIDGGNSPVY